VRRKLHLSAEIKNIIVYLPSWNLDPDTANGTYYFRDCLNENYNFLFAQKNYTILITPHPKSDPEIEREIFKNFS